MKKFCFHKYDKRIAELVMPPSYYDRKVGRKTHREVILHPTEIVYDVCSKCGKEKFRYQRETFPTEIEVHYGDF